MKSIKPGRGPSAMGAMGSIIAVIFGIFWTIAAASMGAPFFISPVRRAVYHHGHCAGGVQLQKCHRGAPLLGI